MYDAILKFLFINISLIVWFKFKIYFYNKISEYLLKLSNKDKLDKAHENKVKREKEEKAELERLKSEMDLIQKLLLKKELNGL